MAGGRAPRRDARLTGERVMATLSSTGFALRVIFSENRVPLFGITR
jgi:hypothetical protein